MTVVQEAECIQPQYCITLRAQFRKFVKERLALRAALQDSQDSVRALSEELVRMEGDHVALTQSYLELARKYDDLRAAREAGGR